jgi:uncharacterized membrane protein
MGVASLVLGIIGLLFAGVILGVLAIIFGNIGMNRAKRGEATNGGMAKAGLILGIIGVVLGAITIAVFSIP